MHNSHFIAVEFPPSGYTYTLTTRLADIINKVEEKYGPRDQSWTILGVEFGPGTVPQIWYPFNQKFLAVQLTHHALNDQFLATWQLAHEAVHFLAPTRRAKVIEEGAATVFQQDYGRSEFGRLGQICDPRYLRAEALVRELLDVDPDAIKRLRVIEPSFSHMTAASFEHAEIELRDGLLTELLEEF